MTGSTGLVPMANVVGWIPGAGEPVPTRENNLVPMVELVLWWPNSPHRVTPNAVCPLPDPPYESGIVLFFTFKNKHVYAHLPLCVSRASFHGCCDGAFFGLGPIPPELANIPHLSDVDLTENRVPGWPLRVKRFFFFPHI